MELIVFHGTVFLRAQIYYGRCKWGCFNYCDLPGTSQDITYTLNQANQITQVDGTINSTNTTYAQNATYAPFGPLKTYIAGNSLPIINQYDSDYQLTTLKAGAVLNRGYQYDETGNVTQISNMGALPAATAEVMTYAYQNNNNQLTQAINGSNTTFAYNAAGNLITA